MTDWSNPHSRRAVSDGLAGYRTPTFARDDRVGHLGVKRPVPQRYARPTVTGCRYDDILWKIEWACEEALVANDDFAAILPLISERVELPVDDQIVLAEAGTKGVRPLLDLTFGLLGDSNPG